MVRNSKPAWSSRRLRGAGAALIRSSWQLSTALPPFTKRILDVLISAAVLLAAAPLFALIALFIKCEDGGPVLYWQSRVGKHGRLMRFPKFRSMVLDAERRLAALREQNQHGDGITFKMKNDPRITRVGRVLRRFSLDEAPQLWCVLTGEMTLVGPRPALPGEVARYSVADRRRLDVKPGLTCIWQVSGRSSLPFPVQCRMDIDYIEERSLALDAKLLAATIPAVISGKGAY
jgi:lipopolysaccharide/colanic/teichoic acid biosynthesis glycosyltransferase